MSRCDYTDECNNNWGLIRWLGAVKSAIYGRRGQQFLRELIETLDAMPEKRLIADELEADGAVCALGAVGQRRGIRLDQLDPYDPESVAHAFRISPTLVREITYVNDESYIRPSEDPAERRWTIVREWAKSHIEKPIEQTEVKP